MNRYAALAKRHWTQVDPNRVNSLQDPEGFFRELGDQAEQEIQDLTQQLAGPDPVAGEGYLEKVARLNAARSQAEEKILRELILIAAPEEDEGHLEHLDWVMQTQARMARDLAEEE